MGRKTCACNGLAARGEVTLGEAREQIAEIGIGFDAVHLACADQAGEAGPVARPLVMACEERIATCVDAPCLTSRIFDLSAGYSIGRVSGL